MPVPESAQAGADVFHPPVEPQRVAGGGDEPVVGVKLRCLIIDGVHHDEPGSGGLAGGNGLAERFVWVPVTVSHSLICGFAATGA